jgi:hypothetical protein
MTTHTAIIHVNYTACEKTDPSDKADAIVRDLQKFLGFDACLDDILDHDEPTEEQTTTPEPKQPALNLYRVWAEGHSHVWLMASCESDAVTGFHVLQGKKHRYATQVIVVKVQSGDQC